MLVWTFVRQSARKPVPQNFWPCISSSENPGRGRLRNHGALCLLFIKELRIRIALFSKTNLKIHWNKTIEIQIHFLLTSAFHIPIDLVFHSRLRYIEVLALSVLWPHTVSKLCASCDSKLKPRTFSFRKSVLLYASATEITTFQW